MKRVIVLGGLLFMGVAAWRIGDRLSGDAIGMALGVLFGILAGLPVALLVLASNRRRDRHDEEESYGRGARANRQALPPGYGYPMPAQQPPIIVLAGPPAAMPQGNPYGYQGYPQQRDVARPQWRADGDAARAPITGEHNGDPLKNGR
ncbi:MAG: hypothetical protein R2932_25830 [Caldilineaceae bacterium]